MITWVLGEVCDLHRLHEKYTQTGTTGRAGQHVHLRVCPHRALTHDGNSQLRRSLPYCTSTRYQIRFWTEVTNLLWMVLGFPVHPDRRTVQLALSL